MNVLYLLIFLFCFSKISLKTEIPPIPIWHEYLKHFFEDYNPFPTIDYSFLDDDKNLQLNFNKFEDEKNCKKEGFSYYLFLIQTILIYKEEVDYRSYLGICLPNYNASELDLVLMTYFYLWENKNLTHSFIIDYETPLIENTGIRFRAIFFVFILIIYLFLNIYVSIFPSTEIFKSNIEIEKEKKKTEEDIQYLLQENFEGNNKLGNLDLIQTYNYNNIYGKKENKKQFGLSAKDKIDEFFSIYDAKIISEIYNCFSLKLNLKSLLSNKIEKMNEEEREIKILNGMVSFSFIIVSYYTCLPILERVPIKNPKNFYKISESIFTQLFFNGDFIYDIIFTLNGFITSSVYIRKKKEMNIKNVLLYIFYSIFPIYFLIISVYLIYSQIFPLFNHGPLPKYFYNEEIYSCDCQMVNIVLLIVNFTYGLYEKYFPFCIYHIWTILANQQYFIAGIFLMFSYAKFKALFVVIFTLLTFNIFILHIFSILGYTKPLTYIDLINRNLRSFYGQYGLKIFTRAGPFLIGFICGFLYYHSKRQSKKKLYTIVSNMQNKYLYANLIFFFILFFLIFNAIYFEINDYVSFIDYYWPGWLFNLFKHDFFSISILGITISCLSVKNNSIKQFVDFIFLNKFSLFLSKISPCYYILLAIVARGYFYRFSEPISVSNLSLIYYLIIISFINIISSIIFYLLFQRPFVGINEIIKNISLNK